MQNLWKINNVRKFPLMSDTDNFLFDECQENSSKEVLLFRDFFIDL